MKKDQKYDQLELAKTPTQDQTDQKITKNENAIQNKSQWRPARKKLSRQSRHKIAEQYKEEQPHIPEQKRQHSTREI